jgi:hypothetical protein
MVYQLSPQSESHSLAWTDSQLVAKEPRHGDCVTRARTPFA